MAACPSSATEVGCHSKPAPDSGRVRKKDADTWDYA